MECRVSVVRLLSQAVRLLDYTQHFKPFKLGAVRTCASTPRSPFYPRLLDSIQELLEWKAVYNDFLTTNTKSTRRIKKKVSEADKARDRKDREAKGC